MNYFFIFIFILFGILFFRYIKNKEANNNYPIEKIFKIDEFKKDFAGAGFKITVENDILLDIFSFIGPYFLKIQAKHTKNGASIFFKIVIDRFRKAGFSILSTFKNFETETCELYLAPNNFSNLPVYINITLFQNIIFTREHFKYIDEFFEDSLRLQNKIIDSYINKEELEKSLLESNNKFKVIDFFKNNFVFSILASWYLIVLGLAFYSNYTYNYTLFTFTHELLENYSYIPGIIILIIWLSDKDYKFPYYLGFIILNKVMDFFFLFFTSEIKSMISYNIILFLFLIISQLIYNFFQKQSYKKHKIIN